MIEVNDFKKGLCLYHKNLPVIIVDVTFSTPTARGGATIAKTRMRNLLNGQLISDSIRSGERFEEVNHEMRDITFLYDDGSLWYFMESESFEQFEMTKEELGEKIGFLKNDVKGMRSVLIEERVVDVILPNTVDLEVVEAEPAIKGATAQAQLKRAVMETGIEIQVPPYVVVGEMIRIDTRDKHFVERVKK